MKKVLSIIVPTYNMQDYLSRGLGSLVLASEYAAVLEVLVINDGSTDKSSEIAHYYERQYTDVFRVIDKDNGNYGSCINRGLIEANGKYVKILDADDWFDNNVFRQYLSILERQIDVDLVLTDFATVNQKGEVIARRSFDLKSGEVFDFEKYDAHQTMFFMHSVTYRTELLRKIGYVQTEGISYTDVEWVGLPMYAIKSCVYYPICLYQYLVGREGQTVDPKIVARQVSHNISVARRLISSYDKLEGVSRYTNDKINELIYGIGCIIYKNCLVEQASDAFDAELLKQYDSCLKISRPEVYAKLEKQMVLNGLPLHYVRFWHRFGFRFPLAFVRDIVRKIRYS